MTEKYISKATYFIDPEYPLVAGDWDIDFQDLQTKNICTRRYVLNRKILIKDIHLDGMKIIRARRMR